MPYNGGNVQEGEHHVYLTFWGAGWNQDPAGKEHILELFRYLNNSPYTGILTQYFDRTGHPGGQVSLSSYTDASITTPEFVSQTKIELEAKKSIESQGWPAPSFGNDYVVLPAPGATEQVGFRTGCARHGFDSELGAAFTFVWYPAGSEHGSCLEAGHQPWEQLQEENAFELAQAITDPQPYNSFGKPGVGGWDHVNSPTPNEYGEIPSSEIGERCYGEGVVQEAPAIWVPRIFDDYLLAEQGLKCVAQDKEPVRFTVAVGATQIPTPHQAIATGTVIPGGWPARYRFNVSDPAIGYSATVPAEFQPVANTKQGEVLSAKLPTVKGGQTYSVTLESYNALTEPDPPFSESTTVLTSTGAFTTPVWTPEVATSGSEAVGPIAATLKGSVNPLASSASYHFDYGTTTAYGSSTATGQAGSGTSPVAVSASASSLRPETTYHYRLVASNSEGTTNGPDQTFTTTAYAPVLQGAFGTAGAGSGQLEYPTGIALDRTGDVWVGDRKNNRLEEFSAGGGFLRSVGSLGSGDGQLREPHGVATAVPQLGDPVLPLVIVADQGNHRVEEFTESGAFVRQFGSTAQGSHQALSQPYGVAPVVSSSGYTSSIWVSDPGRNRVVEYSTEGTFQREVGIGGGGSAPGEFNYPTGVAVDAVGDVWVADTRNNRLQEFGPQGEFIRQVGALGSGNGQLHEPFGLAFESTGNLLVVDEGNSRVQEITPTGGFLTKFGSAGSGAGQLNEPKAIAIGPHRDIYVTDAVNDRVEHWAQATLPQAVTGAASTRANEGVTLAASIDPDGLATTYQFEYGTTGSYGSRAPASPASAGSGYEPVAKSQAITGLRPATTYVYRVAATNSEGTAYGEQRQFTTMARSPTFVSSFGTAGTAAGQFSYPTGIAIDAAGHVWVADRKNNRLEEFGEKGEFIRQVGTKGSGWGQMIEPHGIAISPTNGNLLVVDQGNHRIDRFTGEGAFLESFGESPYGAYPALSTPYGIAFDSVGGLWVSDTSLHRVIGYRPQSGTGPFRAYEQVGGTGEDELAYPTGVLGEPGGDGPLVADASRSVIDETYERGESEKLHIRPYFSTSQGTGAGQLDEPYGLALSPTGQLLVVEKATDRVQEFSLTGELVTQFGTAGSGAGQLSEPKAAATAPNGEIYVTDAANNRVEIWKP